MNLEATEEVVTCDVCHAEYQAIFAASKQAVDCSSSYYPQHSEIVGHYGSRLYDMHLLRTGGSFPFLSEGACVCDRCITQMLSDGRILEDLGSGFI